MVVSPPAFLVNSFPSDDESRLVELMSNRLSAYAVANIEAVSRYEGSWAATQFGISIPPSMSGLQTVAGWGGSVVDVLEERLDWLGWSSDGDDFDLESVYASNGLDVDSGMSHLDSLIFGTSFVTVGSGVDGEPNPLVTPHSPQTMTGIWDARRRRVSSALSVVTENSQIVEATLYLPDETVALSRLNPGGKWAVDDRDQHKLGRVPVVQLPNRVRGSRVEGRSEITKAVRYYCDAAMRTMLGLEVNREFYNSPQRVVLGADETMFKNADGSTASPWTAIQGRVWAVPNDDDGNTPSVEQFSPASPAPYLDQIKGYAQLLAAEAGIPGAYLGFVTDNPASADAIRAGEARLVKRAERRQAVFGRSWLEVGRLALLVRDGAVPVEFDDTVSARWRDASTPTRSAAADETTKYVGAGILPADSSVTYDRMGLSPAEQRQVNADRRRANGSGVLQALADRLNTPETPANPDAFDATP
jgi:hypothetical protein